MCNLGPGPLNGDLGPGDHSLPISATLERPPHDETRYNGAYLCDPYNTDPRCGTPLWGGNSNGNPIPSFNYQLDAISANWPIQLAAYTSYLKYQLEW